MIAKENHDNRLRIGAEGFKQIPDKGIHLVELIDIVPERDSFLLVCNSLQCDGVIVVDQSARILAMPLYRDGIDKVLLCGGVQRIHDRGDENGVLGPAEGIGFNVVHVLQRSKGVKTEVGVDQIAVIKSCGVVMDGVGGISQLFEIIADGLAGCFFQNGLVGIFPCSEVIQIHAGNDLKFRVCRAGAQSWDRQKAMGKVRFEGSKDWHRIFRIGEVAQIVDIKEGLQLHHDNVGRFTGRAVRLRMDIAQKLLYPIDGIVLRLVDTAVKDTAGKTVGKAIVGVCISQIVEFIGENPGRKQQNRGQSGDDTAAADKYQATQPPSLHLSGMAVEYNKTCHNGEKEHNHQDDLPDVEIDLQNAPHRFQKCKIDGRERRGSIAGQNEVRNSKAKPDHGDQGKDKALFSKKGRQGKGSQNDAAVI